MSAAGSVRAGAIPPSASARPRPRSTTASGPPQAMFWGLMLFFLLEFLRPPVISQLKLQLLFALVIVPVAWLMSKDKPWTPVITLQLGFLAKSASSMLHATNYYSAYMACKALLFNASLALAISWLLGYRKEFVRGIWIWCFLMACQAFYSLAIDFGHGYGGFMGDENDLALGVGTALPFALMGAQLLRGGRRILCAGLLVLFVASIVASVSRGGFLGLAAVIIYTILYGKHKVRNLALVAVGAGIFLLAIPSSYKQEIDSISETTTGTAELRFYYWLTASNMFWNNPVLGVGAANGPWEMGKYQLDIELFGMFGSRDYKERDYTSTSIHSLYFELLAEGGLIGIGLWVSMIGMHFAIVSRTRKRVRRSRFADPLLQNDAELYGVAIGGSMVGYLAAGGFLSVLYYPYPYYFVAIAVAYQRMIYRRLDATEAAFRQRAALQANRSEGTEEGVSPSDASPRQGAAALLTSDAQQPRPSSGGTPRPRSANEGGSAAGGSDPERPAHGGGSASLNQLLGSSEDDPTR